MNILVILASYNGDKYLKDQINSILNQKNVDVKIHVFDDSSDDETCKIVGEFDQVELTKRKVGSGSAAINFLEALLELNTKNELTKYDYISFSDQDDIWLENKLSRSIKFLSQGYDLYGSNLTIYKNGMATEEMVIKSQKQTEYDFLFEGGSAGCTYVFTPKLANLVCQNYEKIRWNTWKYFSHDWFVYFLSRLNGFKTYLDNESYIYYRIHQNNVHGEMNVNSIRSFIKRGKFVFNNWYKEHSHGYSQFCERNSIEFKIYSEYNSNYFRKIRILLLFNFKLLRSRSKFFKFFIIDLLKIF